MTRDSNLEIAYSQRSPGETRALYEKWAATYDTNFAQQMDYQLPFAVAEIFVQLGGKGPVLDIGAGTGLAGHALKTLGVGPVDGTDLSPQMLDMARAKNIYRNLFEADVTKGLPVPVGSYGGAVSSGTFTLGHLGPECLGFVFDAVATGGMAVISVSRAHYDNAGFDAALQDIHDRALLTEIEVPIYGAGHVGPNAGDTAVLVCAQMR
jgi:predicted TPR repeat methyltransferase